MAKANTLHPILEARQLQNVTNFYKFDRKIYKKFVSSFSVLCLKLLI